MLYEHIFRKLREQQVRYVVVGGIAMVLHGVVRFTADLDLTLDLSHDNLLRFLSCMNELGFKPRLPVQAGEILDPGKRKQWYQERNMRVFTFFHPNSPLSEVDVLLREMIPFSELEKEASLVRVSDLIVPVVSKEHLKSLKRISGRPQDLADIEALQKIEELGFQDEPKN